MDTQNYIEVINDFPKPGVKFRHIGPLLADKTAFQKAMKALIELIDPSVLAQIDVVAGLDARGFIFATAFQLLAPGSISQAMIRKGSKTPTEKFSIEYGTEYSESTLELEKGLIKPGAKVLIIDDLLATGGSMIAAGILVELAGAVPLVFLTLIELNGLSGKDNIHKQFKDSDVKSLLVYPAGSDTKIPLKPLNAMSKRVLHCSLNVTPEMAEQSNVVMLNHPSLQSLADKLWLRSNYRKGNVDWSYFPDTWPNITFEKKEGLYGKDIIFLMSLDKKETFLEQMALLVALPRQSINSLTVFIPYLGPATHERVDFEGMLATVEPVLKVISSSIPMTRSGPPVIRIMDIHALQEQFYTSDKAIMELMTAIPVLKEYLHEQYKTVDNYPAIAFPDDGAYKRFKHMFGDGYRVVVCSKVRSADGKRDVKIKDYYGWPGNSSEGYDNVLIVDDLVQSGGTLIECAKKLKEAGFKKVSAYVTHAVFPNQSWKRISPELFEQFIVTNTNPSVTDVLTNIKPFVVLGIEELFFNQMCKYYNTRGDMFHRKMNRVFVTSANKDKLEAAYEVFNTKTRSCQIIGISVDSNIPEQPIGMEQTKSGCHNRMLNLFDRIEDKREGDIFVSMENGIYDIEGRYYDFAAVATLHFGQDPAIPNYINIGGPVTIPAKYTHLVKQSLDKKQSVTFGSLFTKETGISDWHKCLSGKSRKDILVSVLRNES